MCSISVLTIKANRIWKLWNMVFSSTLHENLFRWCNKTTQLALADLFRKGPPQLFCTTRKEMYGYVVSFNTPTLLLSLHFRICDTRLLSVKPCGIFLEFPTRTALGMCEVLRYPYNLYRNYSWHTHTALCLTNSVCIVSQSQTFQRRYGRYT